MRTIKTDDTLEGVATSVEDGIRQEFAERHGLYAADIGNTTFSIGPNKDITATMDKTTSSGTTIHFTLKPGAGVHLDKDFTVGDEGNVTLRDSKLVGENWNPRRAFRRWMAGEDNNIDRWVNDTDKPTTMVARTDRNILAVDIDKAGGSITATTGSWVGSAFSEAVGRTRVDWSFRWRPWSNHSFSGGNSAWKQTITGDRNFALIDARGTPSISEVKKGEKPEFIKSAEYLTSSDDVKLRTKWKMSLSRILSGSSRVMGMGLSTDADLGYYVSTNNASHDRAANAARPMPKVA